MTARHFSSSDGAMHKDGCREDLGATQRQQIAAALQRCQSSSARVQDQEGLGQGVLPRQPLSMAPFQCCSQEVSRETFLPEADGIWMGLLGVPA